MPFGQREVAGISLAAVHQATRHLPAVFQIQLTREIAELHLKEGKILGRHGVGINSAPYRVGVPAPFLLVEDDNARLVGKAVLFFDPRDSALKDINGNALLRRRIE